MLILLLIVDNCQQQLIVSDNKQNRNERATQHQERLDGQPNEPSDLPYRFTDIIYYLVKKNP